MDDKLDLDFGVALQKEEVNQVKLDNGLKRQEIHDRREDRLLRRELGEKIYTFVSMYMFVVFLLLLLNGMPNSFYLSDAVLITILGTTTANVIGILAIVAAYYFHRKK